MSGFFDLLCHKVSNKIDNLFEKFKNISDKDYDKFENIKNKIEKAQENNKIEEEKFKNKFCDDYVNYLDKQINNMVNNKIKDFQYEKDGGISKNFYKSMYYDEKKKKETYQYFPVNPGICEKKIIDFMKNKYGPNSKINLRFHKWDDDDAWALSECDYFYHTISIMPTTKTINITQHY